VDDVPERRGSGWSAVRFHARSLAFDTVVFWTSAAIVQSAARSTYTITRPNSTAPTIFERGLARLNPHRER
jgi:hypothetical protein